MKRQPLLTLTTALKTIALAAILPATAACSMIDDDLTDCEDNTKQNYELNYELKLVTNISTEMQTQLSMQTDVEIASVLRQRLNSIFTDHAEDVELSFYDDKQPMQRLEYVPQKMDASQASFTLYIPRRQYMHLATANTMRNTAVNITGDDYCNTAALTTVPRWSGTSGDTIANHDTGLFTARTDMDIQQDVNQHFDVHLYMANCATALIIDTQGNNPQKTEMLATGFASTFNLADSTYTYPTARPLYVKATDIGKGNNGEICLLTVNFPSKEPASPQAAPAKGPAKTIIETTDPFVTTSQQPGLWEMHVYITLADGSITQSILTVSEPLRAGQLKIIHAKLSCDGGVSTTDQTVSVSIKTNWNEGQNHEIEL